MSTYSTIVLIIWLSIIFLGAPIALVLFKNPSLTVERIEWIVGAIALALLLLAGWRLRRGLKRRMKQGLNREVQDHELTSIATWMEIPDQAARAAREADKYDFDN